MKRLIQAFLQVLGYLLAIFIVMVPAVILTKLIFGDLESIELRLQILLLGLQAVLAVAAVNAFLAGVRKSKLVRKGWPKLRRSTRWFGKGVLIGLLICGGMLAITGLSGGGTLMFNDQELHQYAQYVLPLLFFLLILALGEEWIFRGYPMAKLSPVVGHGWAIVIVSVLFMAAHWGGNGWNVLTAVNIFLFSCVHGALRFTPGGVPAAWGFHFAWNGLHVILGATLTGETYGVPAIQFSSTGPNWLSGGAYGPEGGLGTTVASVVGLIVIWRYLRP